MIFSILILCALVFWLAHIYTKEKEKCIELEQKINHLKAHHDFTLEMAIMDPEYFLEMIDKSKAKALIDETTNKRK